MQDQVSSLRSAPDKAFSTLAVINPADGSVKELSTPYASYGNISVQQVLVPIPFEVFIIERPNQHWYLGPVYIRFAGFQHCREVLH